MSRLNRLHWRCLNLLRAATLPLRVSARKSSDSLFISMPPRCLFRVHCSDDEASHREALIARRRFLRLAGLLMLSGLGATGCAAWPRATHPPQMHNPFPQLERVAVMPFFNQSNAPTLDGFEVATLYQTELQKIPGFQVMPVGVVEQYLKDERISLDATTDFQQVARDLGVDVLVVGSITDFDPYSPPRVGLAVDWFAANPGFHPIPVGYGLPWGTPEEEYLPDALVRESEFELAQQQLATQTPRATPAGNDSETGEGASDSAEGEPGAEASFPLPGLPHDWPDPQGLIPPEPLESRPPLRVHRGPIMDLVRQYDAADDEVLAKLQVYDSWQPEMRPGGWKGRLQRSDDFMRFCCHMHLAEMLAARGGVDRSSLVLRVPGGR